MARCPFASWTPLPENWSQPRIAPTQIILHSAVSKASSLYDYFSKPGVVLESHFYIDQDGRIEQMLDTEVRADANYWANPRAVSIETWDNGDPDRIVWNPAQLAALVRLVRWLSDTHSIPLRSCPAWDAPGVGYHSQFPQWSPVVKTCPGLARRPQVPQIIAAAAAPSAPSAPTPPPARQETDMRLIRRTSDGSIALIGERTFMPLSSIDEANALGVVWGQPVEVTDFMWRLHSDVLTRNIAGQVTHLADTDLSAIATAVADEQHRRMES